MIDFKSKVPWRSWLSYPARRKTMLSVVCVWFCCGGFRSKVQGIRPKVGGGVRSGVRSRESGPRSGVSQGVMSRQSGPRSGGCWSRVRSMVQGIRSKVGSGGGGGLGRSINSDWLVNSFKMVVCEKKSLVIFWTQKFWLNLKNNSQRQLL